MLWYFSRPEVAESLYAPLWFFAGFLVVLFGRSYKYGSNEER